MKTLILQMYSMIMIIIVLLCKGLLPSVEIDLITALLGSFCLGSQA